MDYASGEIIATSDGVILVIDGAAGPHTFVTSSTELLARRGRLSSRKAKAGLLEIDAVRCSEAARGLCPFPGVLLHGILTDWCSDQLSVTLRGGLDRQDSIAEVGIPLMGVPLRNALFSGPLHFPHWPHHNQERGARGSFNTQHDSATEFPSATSSLTIDNYLVSAEQPSKPPVPALTGEYFYSLTTKLRASRLPRPDTVIW